MHIYCSRLLRQTAIPCRNIETVFFAEIAETLSRACIVLPAFLQEWEHYAMSCIMLQCIIYFLRNAGNCAIAVQIRPII